MKYSAKVLFASAAIAAMTLFASCGNTENISGQWQGNPTRLELQVPGIANAMTTTTLNFSPGSDTRTGHISISSVIELEQALQGSPENSFSEPYAVSISATAGAEGTYVFEQGDDDDVLVSLFPASITVNVDPDGVTFDRKILTGTMQAHVDSLTNAVVAQMKGIITNAVREEYSKYSRIEDIKVHHGDMMSCEINDRDQTFRKVY